MRVKQTLPIGIDDFRKIREESYFYIDKTLMIQDFIDLRDAVALITRPRRFGKTLNMTMIRDFFDITQDSSKIFQGLQIMNTKYAELLNSRPVIYMTFKDCKGTDKEEMLSFLRNELYREYLVHEPIMHERLLGSYIRQDLAL